LFELQAKNTRKDFHPSKAPGSNPEHTRNSTRTVSYWACVCISLNRPWWLLCIQCYHHSSQRKTEVVKSRQHV